MSFWKRSVEHPRDAQFPFFYKSAPSRGAHGRQYKAVDLYWRSINNNSPEWCWRSSLVYFHMRLTDLYSYGFVFYRKIFQIKRIAFFIFNLIPGSHNGKFFVLEKAKVMAQSDSALLSFLQFSLNVYYLPTSANVWRTYGGKSQNYSGMATESVRESNINSGIARLISRWRAVPNVKNTSDTFGRA